MNGLASTTVTPVCVADLFAEADLDPRLSPLSEQDFDLGGIDIVVNTHLHFDCGGNRLFAGRPIHVQRRELDDARSEDDYTIREWVEAPGVRYVPVDGELELLPGLRGARPRTGLARSRARAVATPHRLVRTRGPPTGPFGLPSDRGHTP